LIFGVSVHGVDRWGAMLGLILVAILPFVALGVLFGHLLTVESMGPALGGAAALLAILGGIFYPLADGSTLQKIGEYIPSYWISQASHVGIGGDAWPVRGWLVVLAWLVGLTALAAWAYRRDTQRV
jgi:ABC-2 type transport system permease protein